MKNTASSCNSSQYEPWEDVHDNLEIPDSAKINRKHLIEVDESGTVVNGNLLLDVAKKLGYSDVPYMKKDPKHKRHFK